MKDVTETIDLAWKVMYSARDRLAIVVDWTDSVLENIAAASECIVFAAE